MTSIRLALLDRRGDPIGVAILTAAGDIEAFLQGTLNTEISLEPIYPWDIHDPYRDRHFELKNGFPHWVSRLTDQPLDYSGEWVWTAGDELNRTNRKKNRFVRRADTTAHEISNFNVLLADHRQTMMDALSHIHSADARADLQIDHIYQTLGYMLEQQEADLLDQKALQPEDDETISETDRARVKTALNEINKLSVSVQGLRRAHLLPSSRIRIAQALIRGHGPGEIIIQIEHYYLLAIRLSERLVADTDTDTKLANMIANLGKDEGRNPTDRLVPKDHRGALFSVDIDALYRKIILPPPQFGSGSGE